MRVRVSVYVEVMFKQLKYMCTTHAILAFVYEETKRVSESVFYILPQPVVTNWNKLRDSGERNIYLTHRNGEYLMRSDCERPFIKPQPKYLHTYTKPAPAHRATKWVVEYNGNGNIQYRTLSIWMLRVSTRFPFVQYSII